MKFLCFPLLLLLLISCSDSGTKRSKLLDFVPKNTSIILKSSNAESLKNSITNSGFLQEFSKLESYKDLQNKLNGLSVIKPANDFLICFSKDSKDSIQYSIITKLSKGLFKTDSLSNYIEEKLSYQNKTITKSTINSNTFYSTVIDSTFIASSSNRIIEGFYNYPEKNTELEKLYNATDNDKTFSVILKPNNPFISSFFNEDSLSLDTFSEYLALDIELNQKELAFNGITKANDSTNSLINIFKNTVPQENQIQNIAPSNSDGFMSFTFDNFKVFESNLSKFNRKDSITHNTSLFNDIVEVGVIYEGNNSAVVINSIDAIATNDALTGEQTTVSNYREIDIFSFSQPVLFAQTFSPLITFNKANLYCNLDHFFVFANSIETLQNIIANYQNKTFLASKSYFKASKENLSDASSLLQVSNTSALKSIINKNLEGQPTYRLDNYDASAIQFIYDNNFAHVNGIIKKNKTRATVNSVSEELNIKLDTDLLNNPQLVKNHITKTLEIVVQDINNNLYLISNKGKILWKKQLQGPVLGKIEQIDIYKNGRLQLAFATPKRVYVLDRNGKEVRPFALKFNDVITQPLSVFDYDNRKNYRVLVTQGKSVLMYDIKGKTVKGFKFKSANNTIISQPKHFRIGNKDYISLKTKNKLFILDRTGKTRVKPKESHTYSNQPVFLFNNTFTTTTHSGDLISVHPNGRVSKRSLNLSEAHFLETTSKTLVAQSENKLLIKSKTNELDFGEYSNPKIFYINDKIYVSTTDLQSHKVYLFDSQSKLLPNFPVYGNSSIDLNNIDKDRNLEFVAKGEGNAVILYQIN
ncbi:ribonuclease HII [Tamlana sp. 2201CG12-4]|uniref:ribonuclease HII n=1 Tax=Tamlana sp. 2201CG12-4 TaxID=3112582 RepID=UPI002DB57B50|nr:ribonuclease HII [Tamlana sp. 2201CG12-4]MEC3905390.1 ribonuclease HII [Tamlana sp. 2201CG12-4]